MKQEKNCAGEPRATNVEANARVQQSLLSVAVAVGQINMYPRETASSSPHQHAPSLAHAQLDWLLSAGGFSERELVPALKREILQWDEQALRLVCFLGWVRWLVAAMVVTFALGFAGAGWVVIVQGEHSFAWAAVTLMCGAFSVGALHWLQAYIFGPRRVAVRAARKLRSAGF